MTPLQLIAALIAIVCLLLDIFRFLIRRSSKISEVRRQEYSKASVQHSRVSFLTLGQPTSQKWLWIAASYDFPTDQSKTVAYLTCRDGAAIASLGMDETIITGGYVDDRISSSVEIFDFRKRLTRTLPPLKRARWRHGVCVSGSDVVVIGGHVGYTCVSSCEVFSRYNGRWETLSDLKMCRCNFAVVSLPDKRIFVIGGSDSGAMTAVEVCRLPIDYTSSPMNLETFWSNSSPMRKARRGHAAALLQYNIFVVGGCNLEEGNFTSAEMFSIENDYNGPWVYLSSVMKVERSFFSLVKTSNGLFAFGNEEEPRNSLEHLGDGRIGQVKTMLKVRGAVVIATCLPE